MDKKVVKTMKKVAGFIVVLNLILPMAFAQKACLKTNRLYSTATTPTVNYIRREFSNNRKLEHSLIDPDLKKWLCDTFKGSFIGVQLPDGRYNMRYIRIGDDKSSYEKCDKRIRTDGNDSRGPTKATQYVAQYNQWLKSKGR